MLPNVLVVGAAKCGTTALYHRFAQHPECAVCPDHKELHFFIDGGPWPIGNWSRGIGWYEALFPEAKIVADVGPSYTFAPIYPGVATRARAVVPGALIVYLVRDPVDRAVSHWMHFRDRDYDRRPFEEAVLDPDPGNLYLAASRFGLQLGNWLDEYPPGQVLALHQRDLASGADGVLWRKLGVEPPVAGGSERHFESTGFTEPWALDRLPGPVRRVLPARVRRRPLRRPTVSAETRAALHELLADDVSRFYRLCDVRLDGWPD